MIFALNSTEGPGYVSCRTDAYRGVVYSLETAIAGARVEVIEVKVDLNRPVLGQVIAGADLLEIEYAPAQVDPVVVCAVGDPALEAVCERRGIAVVVSAAE